MFLLKVAVPGAIVVGAVVDLFHTTAEEVILIVAFCAALVKVWTKVVRPFTRLVHRALTAYELLEQMPGFKRSHDRFIQKTDARLDTLEQTTDEMQQSAKANTSALVALTRELGVSFRDPSATD